MHFDIFKYSTIARESLMLQSNRHTEILSTILPGKRTSDQGLAEDVVPSCISL